MSINGEQINVNRTSRFLTSLSHLVDSAEEDKLTLRRAFEILGEEGHAAIILFLCLPFLQPIPIPGLSTPLGILIVCIGFLLLVKKALYIPQRFQGRKIPLDLMHSVQNIALKISGYSSHILKPRWLVLSDFGLFRALNFLVLFINSFLLALPLPIPFSNTVPTLGIVFLALGQMERDGVFIFASYVWLLVVFSFFSLIGYGVFELLF